MEVKALINGETLKPFTPIKPPSSSGDSSQQVAKPETGGRPLPGLLGGERPQPA
jgi:hypothetical protein